MSENKHESPEPDLALAILLLGFIVWPGLSKTPLYSWQTVASFSLLCLPLAGIVYWRTQSPWAIGFPVGIFVLFVMQAVISSLHDVTGLWWLDQNHRGARLFLGALSAMPAFGSLEVAMNWGHKNRGKTDEVVQQS